MAVRVLIADGSLITRDIIRHHLECGGCEVVAETDTVGQTMDLFRTTRPNVVTLDVGLKGSGYVDALSLFRAIRKESPQTSIVMIGASQREDYRAIFMREGALECILEPFDSVGLERMWRQLSAIYPQLQRRDQAASGR
jgi:two-component system, chemotaxis family, chemotaxis protein CheY